MSLERIPKHIRKIIPDLVALDIVREDRLRRAGVQSIARGADLDRDAAGPGVATEGLRVSGVWEDCCFGADGAADGPDVDGDLAVVGYDGEAEAVGIWGGGG